MRNRNPKIVEILHDDMAGVPVEFRCKVCGITWRPKIKRKYEYPLGCEVHFDKKVEELFDKQEEEFYGKRGGWQCPNGCKAEAAEER